MGKDEHKTIFDKKYYYTKVSVEIHKIRGLTSDDRIILSRIIFWTKKGMPCTQTNIHFAELIEKSIGTARNVIAKLIERKLVDAHYKSDGKSHRRGAYRDLTALVGVDAKMVVKRKAAQTIRDMSGKQLKPASPLAGTTKGLDNSTGKPKEPNTCQPVSRGGASPLAGIQPKPANRLASTTEDIKLSNKQLSAGRELLPVRQAPPAKEKTKRKRLTENEFAVQKEIQLKALKAGESIRGCDTPPSPKDETYIR